MSSCGPDILAQVEDAFLGDDSSEKLSGVINDYFSKPAPPLDECSIFEKDFDSQQNDMSNFIQGGKFLLPILKSILFLNSKMSTYYTTNINKYLNLVDNIKLELEITQGRMSAYETLYYNASKHFKSPSLLQSIHCQYNAFYSIFRILQHNFIALKTYYLHINENMYSLIEKSQNIYFNDFKNNISMIIYELQSTK
jgi:hypothetical protein